MAPKSGGGKRTPQVRAPVAEGDHLVLVASGALGMAPENEGQSFARMPAVSLPLECPRLESPTAGRSGDLLSRVGRGEP